MDPTSYPDRNRVVIRHIVERHARERPDDKAVIFDDETFWTWRQALAESYRAANYLAGLGVGRGEHVAVFLPNGPGFLRAWWGINFLGAVMASINAQHKGTILAQECTSVSATRIITDEAGSRSLESAGVGLRASDSRELERGADSPPPLTSPIEPWDMHAIVYTSGTTGNSKGVLTAYAQPYGCIESLWLPRIRKGDVLCQHLPFHHCGGQAPALAFWSLGEAVAVVPGFSATGFLARTRRLGITHALFVSSMAPYLASLPEQPDDADTPLRFLMVSPVPPGHRAFGAVRPDRDRDQLRKHGGGVRVPDHGGDHRSRILRQGEARDVGPAGRRAR